MSLQFRDKNVVSGSVKCFTQVQVVEASNSSLIQYLCNPCQKGHQNCQAWFAVSEVCHKSPLYFPCTLGSYQKVWLHGFARHWGDWLSCSSLDLPSLFLFLKIQIMFPLFESVGTSLDCHDFWSMMDSDLATSSPVDSGPRQAYCCVPLTCTLSGFLDILEFDLQQMVGSLFSQSLPLSSAIWMVWLENLLVKKEAKN